VEALQKGHQQKKESSQCHRLNQRRTGGLFTQTGGLEIWHDGVRRGPAKKSTISIKGKGLGGGVKKRRWRGRGMYGVTELV